MTDGDTLPLALTYHDDEGGEAVGIGVYLLQAALFAIVAVLMLATKQVSLTGWWTVIVVGFIGLMGKLYDHLREQKNSKPGNGH